MALKVDRSELDAYLWPLNGAPEATAKMIEDAAKHYYEYACSNLFEYGTDPNDRSKVNSYRLAFYPKRNAS